MTERRRRSLLGAAFRQYVSRDAGVLDAHRLYADEACETKAQSTSSHRLVKTLVRWLGGSSQETEKLHNQVIE